MCEIVWPTKRLYWLKQVSRSRPVHLTSFFKTLGVHRCLVDACVFRLIEERHVAIIAVVHVDDTFCYRTET